MSTQTISIVHGLQNEAVLLQSRNAEECRFGAQCDNQGIIGEVSAVIEGNRTLIRLDFLNVADAQVNVRAAQKLVERQSYCFLCDVASLPDGAIP